MLAIRLPLDIETRLGELAAKTGRTKTFYARKAILKFIEDLEDIYLAEERIEAIRSNHVKTIPIKDIMSEYGLDN